MSALETLRTFTTKQLPDLDTVVLGALELFASEPLPEVVVPYERPLVAGSGNANVTARILFDSSDAVFASENNYKHKLNDIPSIDGVVIVSSSGGKHAPVIAQYAQSHNQSVLLLTNNPVAPAREYSTDVIVFPKNREPYTYNTSTYLGMILSHTHEDVEGIHTFITTQIEGALHDNLKKFHSYCFIIPPQFHHVGEMFETKFSELFGARVQGRVFTSEEIKHAKTIVPSETELFVSVGEENTLWGDENRRLHIPLPENAGYGAVMAIGYYVIGKIQGAHPPYFKENIDSYLEKTADVFDKKINSIVE